jgi:hypothetical protein
MEFIMSSRHAQWLEDEDAYAEQKDLIGAREYKRLTTNPTIADIHEAFEWFTSNDSAVALTISALGGPVSPAVWGVVYKQMLFKAFEDMAEGFATMEMDKLEQEAERD